MLDNITTFEKLDPKKVSYGIENLSEQLNIVWEETRDWKIPATYKKVENIVIVGMGGSALGPEIIVAGLSKKLKVPCEVVRGYSVPNYVGRKTLVILSSFSGSTEEVLVAAKEAHSKKAKIVSISSGGKLAAWAKRNKYPLYKFEPGQLALQPRLGVGFSLTAILALLSSLSLVKISAKEILGMIAAMQDVVDTCGLHVDTKENPAKTVALELKDKMVFYVASEHLVGNAHLTANQTNETAKQYATWGVLPEINHHLLEGLSFPKDGFKQFVVLMIKSSLYNKRVQIRYDITADIFEKQGGDVIEYEAKGENILEEIAEVMQFGSFLSYYLGILNEVDLEAIPFVNHFKQELSKKK